MSQLTFPESMTPLDVNDVVKSLNILQNYIGYICERADFALRNMTKTVTEAGVSSVEMYIRVVALENEVAPIKSSVQTMEPKVSYLMNTVGEDANHGLRKAVGDLETTVGDANSGLVKSVSDLSTAVSDLSTTVGDANSGLVKDVADALGGIAQILAAIGDTSTAGTILYQLDDLDRRVTALENQP